MFLSQFVEFNQALNSGRFCSWEKSPLPLPGNYKTKIEFFIFHFFIRDITNIFTSPLIVFPPNTEGTSDPREAIAYTGQNIPAKQKQLCRHSWAVSKIGMRIKEKHNPTLSEESGSGYRKTHLNLAISAQILHSTPYFFIIVFPTTFFLHSRMTGKYLISFYKKRFSLSPHTCPFRQLRWHFSQGKASHSLLQRRFAPRKAVRLLPDKRGQLADCILSFISRHAGTAFFI